MSNVVTNLCRPLQLSPAQKAVLMALADRADDAGVGWPSVAWIGEWTCLGRSTVIRAVASLEDLHFIFVERAEGRQSRCTIVSTNIIAATASVSRSGATRTAAGPVFEAVDGTDPSRSDTGPDLQPVSDRDGYPSQSGTGQEMTPVPDRDTPPSRSDTPPVPDRDTPRPAAGPDTPIDTNKTPDKTSKKARAKSSFDPLSAELPDWLPPETWAMWVGDRVAAKKALTADAVRLQLKSLGKLRGAGHDPVLVIENAITCRWQGLYANGDRTKAVRQAAETGDLNWLAEAGFTHIAEAQNARCHIANYREFRNGKRVTDGVTA